MILDPKLYPLIGGLLVYVGVMYGSFLSVLAYRWPLMQADKRAGRPPRFTLSLPRSHCPSCQHTIAWYHNMPIISYALLLGRCAYCKINIPARYLLNEGLTGLATACMVLALCTAFDTIDLSILLLSVLCVWGVMTYFALRINIKWNASKNN